MKKVLVIALAAALLVIAGGVVAARTDRSETAITGSERQVQPQVAPRPVLGIAVANLDKKRAEVMGLEKDSGVVIVRVHTGSPAATAGLKVRDIVLTVNAAPVATVQALRAALQSAGSQVTLTVLRGKETLTITASPKPVQEWLQSTPPAWLPEMGGIKVGERFAHSLGSQRAFLDKDGKKHTITSTPGVVKEVKDNSLTITPNGQTEAVTFAVTDKTVVRVAGGQIGSLKAGDKVVVITVDNANDARLVVGAAGGPGFMRGHGKGFGHGGFRGGFPGRPGQGAPGPAIAPFQGPAPSRVAPGGSA